MYSTTNSLSGFPVIRSSYLPTGFIGFVDGKIVVGRPHTSKVIYDIFHQGDMLKWYEYIGEGKGSLFDDLFGYHNGQ